MTLHHFCPALSPIVETDASNDAIAGIILSALLHGLSATSWLVYGDGYIVRILLSPLLEFLRDVSVLLEPVGARDVRWAFSRRVPKLSWLCSPDGHVRLFIDC